MSIGSFLYNIAIDCLQECACVDSKNQSFLPYDLKIKPRGIPLRASGNNTNWYCLTRLDSFIENKFFAVEKDPVRDSEIIEGFYSKQQLKYFFEQNTQM